MPKPLIVITGQTDAAEGVYGVKERWANWLFNGGAAVVIAPPFARDEDVDRILSVADGVLVPGGVDVNPALYGAKQLDPSRQLAPMRDRYEMQVITEAIGRDLPLLCVCRGFQLLNVAFGGTLNQRISDTPGCAVHWQEPPYTRPSHVVEVTEGTLLSKAIGAGRHDVCSLHVQGVCNPAPGLVVSATAEDGLIEGLEHPSARFCVGVQWHPEHMPEDEGSKRLLGAFLKACMH